MGHLLTLGRVSGRPVDRREGQTYRSPLAKPGGYPTELEQGWVTEVLRMTILAQDIIEAVLSGKQPRHLNLQALRGRHAPLPRDSEEQRRLFGFSG